MCIYRLEAAGGGSSIQESDDCVSDMRTLAWCWMDVSCLGNLSWDSDHDRKVFI